MEEEGRDTDGMNNRLVRGERRKANKKKDEDASHSSQTTLRPDHSDYSDRYTYEHTKTMQITLKRTLRGETKICIVL